MFPSVSSFLPRCRLLCLVLPVLSACAESPEWKPLFNGQDLSGWTRQNGTANYQVEHDEIVGRTSPGSPNSFLCTEQSYGDFELIFEVKFDWPLNTGVQIRSVQSTVPTGKFSVGRVNGPQVEIAGASGRSGWIYAEATGRGWVSPEPLSEDPAVSRHAFIKKDAWNTFRVLAQGPRIQTWINGHPVGDLVDDELFATHPRGFIGLQVHSIKPDVGPFEVRWRNLKIKSLD